ncbi:MAG: enoyl-CoA hydratase-related protein [Verrucomicrobiota bacterium]
MSETSNDQVVSLHSSDAVGYITFNRPPANAYEIGFHRLFNLAIEQADADPTTRVVIIRSAIEKFFCAGADIKAFSANSTEDNQQMVMLARQALAKIEASSKPFIACLQGHCLGGGLEIALACDMRFGAKGSYKLGLPETRLGLLPGNGGSQRLPRVVGASRAMALLTSGESIEPEEACRIGLIDRLFSPEETIEQVATFACTIAESAPLAVAACKQAVREGMKADLKAGLELENRLVEQLYHTADANEGFLAFTEKRQPNYQGK